MNDFAGISEKAERENRRVHIRGRLRSRALFITLRLCVGLSLPSPSLPTVIGFSPSLLRATMRSAAFSVLAFAATAALAQADDKPVFTVSASRSQRLALMPFFSASRLKSKRLSLNNLPATGLSGGHRQRRPRRPPLAARHSAMSASGRSRSPRSLLSQATKVS